MNCGVGFVSAGLLPPCTCVWQFRHPRACVKFVCDLPQTAAIHQIVMAPTWNRMYLGFKELGI